MEKILLDVETSKHLGTNKEFTPKHCYDNVYNNIGALANEEYKNKEAKVMFAYVSVSKLENIYTRHACYYIDGKAVDPTVLNIYGDKVENYNVHYLPIAIVSVDEYFKLLSREGRTDLFKTLSKVEEIKQKEYIKNGALFIG